MDVEDGLSAGGADVEDRAVSVFDLAVAPDLRSDELHVSEEFGVFSSRFVQTIDVTLGDDEDVRWRAGIDVFKNENLIVFEDFFRRNGAGDDLAEEAVHGVFDFRFLNFV